MIRDRLHPVSRSDSLKRPTSPARPSLCAWIAALGVLLQSVGAAAGEVLCVGCTHVAGGVAIAKAPCTPAVNCCDREAPPPAEHEGDGDDCGCVDVKLSAGVVAAAHATAKLVVTAAPFAIVTMHDLEALAAPAARPAIAARAGPPLVRLLAPSGRRTVLIV
jgi:hypothetical protein